MLIRIRYILLFSIVLFRCFNVSAQIAMPDRVCIGAAKHYFVDPNPVGGSTYTWRINGVTQVGSITNEIDIVWNTAGTFLLDVQEISGNGCAGPIRSGQVFVSPFPVVTLSCSDADNTFYKGSAVTFTAGGGTGYEFFVDAISVQNGASNTYTSNVLTDRQVISVKVTNEAGCSMISDGITVNVITLPQGWEINSTNFIYSGLVTAKVFIDYTAVESGFLGAFAGEECRGIVEAAYYLPASHYVFSLNCYSNLADGESLTFKFYDPVRGEIYNMNRTIVFNSGMITGDGSSPIEMYNTVNFIKSFSAGWNWFSVNAILDNMSLGNVLPAVTANGDYIKDQVSSATYYTGLGWFGSLKVIDPKKLYKLKVRDNCSVNFSGIPVNVNSSSISIGTGWNWIGYQPQNPQPINDALSSLSLANLDYIKNQTKSATFFEGVGWFGPLNTLSPSEGYMIKVTNAGTLKYPDAPGKKSLDNYTDEAQSSFNPAEFEYNGSITASVRLDRDLAVTENDLLFAYVNNQLRGVVRSQYFDPLGKNVLPCVLFSDDQKEVNLLCFGYASAPSVTWQATNNRASDLRIFT